MYDRISIFGAAPYPKEGRVRARREREREREWDGVAVLVNS
jgi:hypothetical protein